MKKNQVQLIIQTKNHYELLKITYSLIKTKHILVLDAEELIGHPLFDSDRWPLAYRLNRFMGQNQDARHLKKMQPRVTNYHNLIKKLIIIRNCTTVLKICRWIQNQTTCFDGLNHLSCFDISLRVISLNQCFLRAFRP